MRSDMLREAVLSCVSYIGLCEFCSVCVEQSCSIGLSETEKLGTDGQWKSSIADDKELLPKVKMTGGTPEVRSVKMLT